MIRERRSGKTSVKKIWKNLNINLALEKAMLEDEIKVFYQPKIESGSTRVVGAEALVRWQKPDGSFVYPDEFIPALEKSGQIVELDYFVYKKVFQTLKKRIDMGKTIVPVSMNVSRVHLRNSQIYDYIRSLFQKYRIPPKYIELELTESIYVENFEIFQPMIHMFRSIGGKISMDDFGSGYSSLNLLTNLPIDILKVDKVFLKHKELLENEKTILGCVIEMAKKLKLDVLCEGVETAQQSQFLSRMGCDMFQGYFYSRPLPEEEYYSYLESHLETEVNETHFSFDGHLRDDSGKYEGILHGSRVEYADGPIEGMRALRFYGGEPFLDCVELPVDILKNDSFSVSMWMKEEQARLWSSIYYAGYENGFCDIMPKAWDMRLSFRIKDGENPSGWNDVGNEIVPQGKWVMVTSCYDSRNHVSTVYINGRRCGILENVINLVDPKVIYLGGDIYAKGFCGYLADLRIFDQALSFEKVKEMYEEIKDRIVQEENLSEQEVPFLDIHFPLNHTLESADGSSECIFQGIEVQYEDGPTEGMGALVFSGGGIGENVLALPKQFEDLKSYSISYWIKDKNPREWVSSFYLKTEHGFMSEVPCAPEKRTIFRVKDLREDDVWHDSVRDSIMKKNTWHQIVLVYNAEIHMVSHYVDGRYNGIKDGCYPIGKPEKILFGGDDYQNSFEGLISDIHIFNKALSLERIQELTGQKKTEE